jgi:hypothetical protein
VALMPFPGTKLGVACDLNLAGTWTDITGWTLQEGTPLAGYTISRGRGNEVTAATPGPLGMKLNNVDGRFTIRNPTGPYYGQLARNTPVRISVPDSLTHMRIEDDTVSGISTPNSAGLSVTGDIELQLDLALSSYYVPGNLASKDDASAQRSWDILLNGDGTVSFSWWSTVGGVGGGFGTSTVPLPLGRISLRITLAVATSTLTFYTSVTPISASPSWTQLGRQLSSGLATSVFASTTAVRVGFNPAAAPFAGPAGKFYGFRIYSGIAGTLKGSPDFTTATPGNATLTDAQANVWTLNGTAVFSNRAYRFHGELSSLPQQWDPTGHDAWTPVTAGGILRRLQQGNTPIASPMRRGITGYPSVPGISLTQTSPQSTVAYWPCEDAQGSTQIAAGIGTNSDGFLVAPMTIGGAPAFQGTAGSASADSVFACSAALPQVQSSVWTAAVPPGGNGTNVSASAVLFLLQIPAGGLGIAATLMHVNFVAGATSQLSLKYATAANGSLTLSLTGGATSAAVTGVNGAALWVEIINDGSGTPTATLSIAGAANSINTSRGTITSIIVNPAAAALGATILGHIWVSYASALANAHPATPIISSGFPLSNLLSAWNGETAGNRIARLAAENGLQGRIYGYPAVSAVMGPQPIDTLANLLQFCEDADRGQLFEPRQTLGIGYRTLASMCNQGAAVTLSAAADEVGVPLDPLDDDAVLRNDVILTRSGGSSAQVQVTSGPLSVKAPPAGAGDYSTALTVYVQSDGQLQHIAGWMTSVGTTDQERFPAVTVDLASTDAAVQAILPAVRDADIGTYLAVTGLTLAWLPPGTIQQLIWGSTEILGDFAWQVTWNTVPELPYEVAVADDVVLGRLDTDGSTLAAGVTSSATTLSVATTNAASPLWTTTAGDFPFDVLISGEQITVTNITGATSPQSFTVTRSVNGVIKAQASGAAVVLFHAPIAALV